MPTPISLHEIDKDMERLRKEIESRQRQYAALEAARTAIYLENPDPLGRNKKQGRTLGPARRVFADAICKMLLEEGQMNRLRILNRLTAAGVVVKSENPLNYIGYILSVDERFEKAEGKYGVWTLAKNCQNSLTDPVEWSQEVYTPNKETADGSAPAASNQREGSVPMVTTEITTQRQSENGKKPTPVPPATQTVITALGPDEPDDGDAGRRQRGMAIAAIGAIEKTRVGYRVRSQSNNPEHPFYAITLKGEDGPACECDDFGLREAPCKHIYGLQFRLMWEGNPEASPEWTESEKRELETETVAKKPSYPRNWSDYNRCQVNEGKNFYHVLRKLADTIPEPPQGMGRPRIPLSERIVSIAAKVYSTMSTRRSMFDLEHAQEKGLLGQVPDFSSITGWLNDPELTPLLIALIEQSALPFAELEDLEENYFACDSSGFMLVNHERWHDYKWGAPKKRRLYAKAHITVGIKSKIVTSAYVTPGPSSDSVQMPAMVKTTARNFNIKEWSADKAYPSVNNYNAVDAAGGVGYIPFQKHHTARPKRRKKDSPPDVWERAYHHFHLQNEDFLDHYHKRSNVETAFWMVKAKVGAAVRSRTPVARVNEVYAKLLCHNLIVVANAMEMLGIDPEFGSIEEAEGAELAMVA